MKIRFRNILMKTRKRNGISILVCAIILTVSLGTLAGCSTAGENTEDASGRSESANLQSGQEADIDAPEQEPVDSDTSYELQNTMMLSFSKEGETEQKQATLVVGDGYSLYLPDEEWQQSGADLWTAAANEQVQLGVMHVEDVSELEKKLTEDGYVTAGDHKWRQEGERIYNIELKESENGVWGVSWCYPADAEEGWGRELPIIADTFAVSASTGAVRILNSSDEGAGEYLNAADRQEIKNIVEEFALAYFDGDADTIQTFLAGTYEGDISTYEGTGTISDLTVKGLSDVDEQRTEDGAYIVSLEYRDSDNEDTFRYVTFTFVRQEDSWKIQFYGLEG